MILSQKCGQWNYLECRACFHLTRPQSWWRLPSLCRRGLTAVAFIEICHLIYNDSIMFSSYFIESLSFPAPLNHLFQLHDMQFWMTFNYINSICTALNWDRVEMWFALTTKHTAKLELSQLICLKSAKPYRKRKNNCLFAVHNIAQDFG